MKTPNEQTTGERVMRGEFDQIAHSLAHRIAEQRDKMRLCAAAHRSTSQEKRKLIALSQALTRIESLRSRLS